MAPDRSISPAPRYLLHHVMKNITLKIALKNRKWDELTDFAKFPEAPKITWVTYPVV